MKILSQFYFFKTTSVLLFMGLVISSGFLYKIYDENEKIMETLNSEKIAIIKDLKKSKKSLEVAISQNAVYNEELHLEREKVSLLLDEIGKVNIDLASLLKYKKEVKRLNGVVVNLCKEKEELIKSNHIYKTQRDSTILVLGKSQRYKDSLIAMNENLHAKIVKSGVKISVIDLKISPLKQTKNDEIKVTDRANKTNKLRVAFTVIGNKVTDPCMKQYYVQIIDAENKVIGDGRYKKFGSSILYYSDLFEVKFKNKTVEVHGDLLDDKFGKGTYFVNIFDKDELVSKTSFALR